MALRRILATAVVGAIALTSCSSTTSTTTTTTTPPARNLAVTSAVRTQLIKAGAALNSLPASDYTGLAPGLTYYAYDPATKTYWAGAALVASRSSQRAEVSVQDDGSYVLFKRPASGAWKAADVGMTGIGGSKCKTAVPASVLKLWHWAAGTCRPRAS
ncbi:MAG: hypothetical protein ACLQCU_13505 [Acidimicrobiales bacterium]